MNTTGSDGLVGSTTGIPWWWVDAPRQTIDHRMPASCDVAIIGSGYTGLSAALALLQAGKSVTVIEQGLPGEGASSRNGGMVGSGHKLGYQNLSARFGQDAALRILSEGIDALKFVQSLIQSEKLDCKYEQCGRFRGAWTPKDFDAMAKDIEWMTTHCGLNASLVDKASQMSEVAVEHYHGGCIFHDHGSLHPGLFHSELLRRVVQEGGNISTENPALAIENEHSSLVVKTLKGRLTAGKVLVATNGYRGALIPEWRRSTIPVSSFLIATEELGEGVAESLIPSGRMIVETRNLSGYYRMSPDRKRIILGGRAALQKIDTATSKIFMKSMLTGLFPQLVTADLTHSWSGYVAMTRDGIPHISQTKKNVTVAGGYNGSGVAMAPYLGYKAAQQILDNPEGETVFSEIPLKTFPLYTGNPWFLPALNRYYRLLDIRDKS